MGQRRKAESVTKKRSERKGRSNGTPKSYQISGMKKHSMRRGYRCYEREETDSQVQKEEQMKSREMGKAEKVVLSV